MALVLEVTQDAPAIIYDKQGEVVGMVEAVEVKHGRNGKAEAKIAFHGFKGMPIARQGMKPPRLHKYKYTPAPPKDCEK